MEHIACPLCRSPKNIPLWKKDDASYVRCSECRMIYENPRLDAAELKEFYSNEAYFVGDPASATTSGYANYFSQCNTNLVREYFDILRKATGLGKGARFLDIGCGPGSLVKTASEFGWQSSGLELSTWAAKLGKSQGIDIFEGTLQDAHFPDASVDVASMFDVLEHLPDPHEVVAEIYRILKPGGYLIAETPNVEGFFTQALYRENADLVKPHAHICLFGPATARRLFESEHFSKVGITTFPYCRKFTPGYFKSVLLTRILPGKTPRQLTWDDSLRIVVRK